MIIGGGFSGAMLALQLAARGVHPVIVEQREEAGRGVAYGTADPAHLLNVPAGKMSGWPGKPDDFADFVGGEPGAFVARQTYGDYLTSQVRAGEAAGQITRVHGAAVAARRTEDSWHVTLADGREIAAETLVLATGNGRPQPFAVPGLPDEQMLQDPWGPRAKERLAEVAGSGAPVLLIGTGLTMIDMMLGLEAQGHRGAVTAVSRRGLVPRAHAPGMTPMPPPDLDEVPQGLSAMTAWLRARSGEGGWRAAVDSLRPVTQTLWARWDEAERARFLRHVRPWWDVHRHRIAPEAAELVRRSIADGRLRVMAGRVTGYADGMVKVAKRGGGESAIEAGLVVNCTGPVEHLRDSRNVLIRQMLDDVLITPGDMGMGIAVDDDGRAGERLWALGPLTKGRWWEITAVPDIRGQVERVAAKVLL